MVLVKGSDESVDMAFGFAELIQKAAARRATIEAIKIGVDEALFPCMETWRKINAAQANPPTPRFA